MPTQVTGAVLTAADLMAFAKRQARIEAQDYFDPRDRRFIKPESVAAWRQDCHLRDRAKARIRRDWPGRLKSAEALIPGSYGIQGRLEITATEIDYTAGQYAPREIYGAVYDYFQATNNI